MEVEGCVGTHNLATKQSVEVLTRDTCDFDESLPKQLNVNCFKVNHFKISTTSTQHM
jgi:hypothetical protein